LGDRTKRATTYKKALELSDGTPKSGMSKYPSDWKVKEAAEAGHLPDQARLNEVLGRAKEGYAPMMNCPRLCAGISRYRGSLYSAE
jgi:hypothetical protein